MACQTIYDEMMSMHLDGLLDNDDERRLLAHVAECAECSPFWEAMQTADAMFLASAGEPVPVPVGFTLKVMESVAQLAMTRPVLEPEVAASPVYALPRLSVLPPLMTAIGDYEPFPPLQMPEYIQEWQNRIASYVRGMAAVGLSLAVAAGLLLALVLSGSLQIGGAFAPAVQMARTFLAAAWTWTRSLVSSIGSDAAVSGVLVVGLLLVAGWQIINNYYQHAGSQHWVENALPAEAAS